MYLKVRVKAGAKEEKVVRMADDHFEISVREKAERNMANERVGEILKTYFKAKNEDPPRVLLVSGHHSPSKIWSVGD